MIQPDIILEKPPWILLIFLEKLLKSNLFNSPVKLNNLLEDISSSPSYR